MVMTQLSLHERMRRLPSVEAVLSSDIMHECVQTLPHALCVDAAREAISAARNAIKASDTAEYTHDDIAQDAARRAQRFNRPSLRRVVNATGVVIHTNLGRSVLAPRAVQAVTDVARGYSTLEYNTDTQARGSRHDHCEKLICKLTGAEAAIAVNNNAAAVMMVLSEFACGQSAIVSRGELVEIGGSFRIPDIMSLSGAHMIEVGTTNKTHAFDYERALSSDVSMLLKVHPSNYRMLGFTESVSIAELTQITAHADHEVLVYEDQGSGAFLPLDASVDYQEPTVAQSIAQGADLVSFSGDKLLGGPQAGIIVGKKALIDRLKAHPLARVLRLDKMTLAALEATLTIYQDEQACRTQVPTVRMLTQTADELLPAAEALYARIHDTLMTQVVAAGKRDSEFFSLSIIPETSRSGGGALPMCDIPTYAVRFTCNASIETLHRYLISERDVPIVGRIKDNALLFDVRTLLSQEEHTEIAQALSDFFMTHPGA